MFELRQPELAATNHVVQAQTFAHSGSRWPLHLASAHSKSSCIRGVMFPHIGDVVRRRLAPRRQKRCPPRCESYRCNEPAAASGLSA